jgi:DNA polymerase
VQIQNLPRSALSPEDLALARRLVKQHNAQVLQLLYGPVPALLSELIRTAFIPAEGCYFVVVDFSAIEARVLAWAANERWRLEVFRTHGRIYEASAARMFKVPLDSIDKHSPLRQKGKIAELALGYHGATGALVTMGALSMGLSLNELPDIVKVWRRENPNIMSFGNGMERHAKQAIRLRVPTGVPGRYRFRYERGVLFLDIPSGRSLAYANARIEEVGGYRNVTYCGVNPDTKQWGLVSTYAGKLLENYTQACARDCLAAALPALEAAGLPVVGHVHDEAIIEASFRTWPNPRDALFQAEEIFGRRIPWAPDLPLTGDGFITDFYRKDA